ncbi:MAG TPA: HEAT repeat domain-containing protein, partial [Planctomycetota bacterium]|nr:HEAT repeat domain-containing protein [Planctomycetota bacterium]
LKLAESPDLAEQEEALRALGRLGAQEAIPLLLSPYTPQGKAQPRADGAPPGPLKPGAFAALRSFPAEAVLPHVRPLVDAQDVDRRVLAAQALRAVRAPGAKDVFLKQLAGDAEEVQAVAARALGELEAREAIPRLLEILANEAPYARSAAAYALSRMQAVEALPALRRAAQEADGYEYEFIRALERFGDDRSRDFVVSGLPLYSEQGVLAAAMWLCRENRPVALQPVLQESSVYVPLNGLRRPDEWRRLCDVRFTEDLDGTLLEIVEQIGTAAGLSVDLEPAETEPDLGFLLDTYHLENPDGRLTGAEALLRVIGLTDYEYEALVETGRIRIVGWDEAEAFWERWGRRALKEK